MSRSLLHYDVKMDTVWSSEILKYIYQTMGHLILDCFNINTNFRKNLKSLKHLSSGGTRFYNVITGLEFLCSNWQNR
jgi:hypothetical protein